MPIKRLSDAELMRKARLAQKRKEAAKKLNASAAELEKTVMEEMQRRKTRVLEHNGTKITRVQTDKTTINSDELLAILTPGQRKLCQKRVFDRQGLEAAVQAGLIDIELVSKHSEIRPNNPYLVTTTVPIR